MGLWVCGFIIYIFFCSFGVHMVLKFGWFSGGENEAIKL